MRTVEELTRAHDMLAQVVLGEICERPKGKSMVVMSANLDVLCWALRHSHNETFEANLQGLRAELEKMGMRQMELPWHYEI